MRGILNKMVKSIRTQAGFSIVEVLIGGLVLVVGLIVMSGFFASAAGRVMESDVRSVLHQVATQDLESIRGLDYNDVGTTDGHPQGVLAADEDRTVQNVKVHLHREVIFWTDSSYSGPYPANYRRVTVTAAATGHDQLKPVELTTNVAGGVPGGTLDITVTDSAGAPVPDAQIVITDAHLIPSVNISSTALRTDSNGKMMVPGLTPDDTPNYVVTVSKPGYNSASSTPRVVVDGLPYGNVPLIIDRVSNMLIKVIDSMGIPVTGLNLTAVGPAGFSQNFVSTASGTNFSNIRFSTDLDPYIIRLPAGQGYDAQQKTITLDPGTNQEVDFIVPAGGPTTTTTLGVGSLTLHVVRSSNGSAVSGATVQLNPGGQVKSTNSSGNVTFTSLTYGTYSLVITKSNYYDYRADVVVDGAESNTIQFIHR
jgi:hypothetical protein